MKISRNLKGIIVLGIMAVFVLVYDIFRYQNSLHQAGAIHYGIGLFLWPSVVLVFLVLSAFFEIIKSKRQK